MGGCFGNGSVKLSVSVESLDGLTRLLAVAISAFRMSGSYLLDEDDLEFTVGPQHQKGSVKDRLLHLLLRSVSLYFRYNPRVMLNQALASLSLVPTAGLRCRLVPPGIVELPVLLLRQAETLLLHQVDFFLSAEGIVDHRQVVPQHALLLPLPLGARVLQLGAL